MELVENVAVRPERGTLTGRALLEGKVVHIPDVLADPDYSFTEAQRLGGFRTMLGVAMLREGIPVGVLALTRSEVRPFTDKQVDLVTTFADQASDRVCGKRLKALLPVLMDAMERHGRPAERSAPPSRPHTQAANVLAAVKDKPFGWPRERGHP